jgi:hypothetical protein
MRREFLHMKNILGLEENDPRSSFKLKIFAPPFKSDFQIGTFVIQGDCFANRFLTGPGGPPGSENIS